MRGAWMMRGATEAPASRLTASARRSVELVSSGPPGALVAQLTAG
jgi:hypothetical protein